MILDPQKRSQRSMHLNKRNLEDQRSITFPYLTHDHPEYLTTMATNWNLRSFPCLQINRDVTLREHTLEKTWTRPSTNPNPTYNDSTKPHVQTRTLYRIRHNVVQYGTGWYRMVQDCTVQQRLKHQIIRSKTKCSKLTKRIAATFTNTG